MRYLILGASAAGINAAKTIRGLDSAGEITVTSRDEQVHSRCMLHYVISGERSPEKASFVEADFFKRHNIRWLAGRGAISLDTDARDNVMGLKLKSGKTVSCSLVVVAAGVKPNIEFLAGTPIKTGRGVKVNEYQETSVAGVFAAGDVCESRETFTGKVMPTPIWPAAVKQGQVAGCNMAGVPKRMEDNFAYQNAMTFFGLPAVSFGLVNPPDTSYRELVDKDAHVYKKVIIQDGRIKGAVLQGDITGAGVLAALIKEGIDVTNYLERIFNLTYADFFAQKENGAFYFTAEQ